jgi:hypothetical protein
MHVALGQDDGSRRAQPGDHKCVLAGPGARKRFRTSGRGKICSVVVILQDDWYAVQRPDGAGFGERGVKPVGLGEGACVQGQDGIQLRPLLVVGGNAIKISLYQCVTAQSVIAECLFDLRDRRFLDL